MAKSKNSQKSSGSKTTSRKASRKPETSKVNRRNNIAYPGKRWLLGIQSRISDLRGRRPHRSFMLTRRRDYRRASGLPGYTQFTMEVAQLLWKHKKLLLTLILVFGSLTILLGGLSSNEMYTQLREAFQEEPDSSADISQAALLSVTALLATPIGEAQQLYVGLMSIIAWLTTVWLLRELLAGNKPRFRDGLYNAGAPLISTLLVVLFLLVQLLPLGLLALVYSALSSVELINEGLGAFLFFVVSLIVISLTLYWLTSTFFALIIVTLQGMYPWRAIKAASDIVIGRRIRILLRLLWMMVMIVFAWAVIIVPAVLLDQWAASKLNWWVSVPWISILTIFLTTATMVWASSYIYLMYRKVVANDAD